MHGIVLVALGAVQIAVGFAVQAQQPTAKPIHDRRRLLLRALGTTRARRR